MTLSPISMRSCLLTAAFLLTIVSSQAQATLFSQVSCSIDGQPTVINATNCNAIGLPPNVQSSAIITFTPSLNANGWYTGVYASEFLAVGSAPANQPFIPAQSTLTLEYDNPLITVGPVRPGFVTIVFQEGPSEVPQDGSGTLTIGLQGLSTSVPLLQTCSFTLGGCPNTFVTLTKVPVTLGVPFSLVLTSSLELHSQPNTSYEDGYLLSRYSFNFYDADGKSVAVTLATPEPSSIAMLSVAGALWLANCMLRRRF